MKREKYSLQTQRHLKAHLCACSVWANATSDWPGVWAEQAHFYCLDASPQEITMVKAPQLLLTVQGKGPRWWNGPRRGWDIQGNGLMGIYEKHMAQDVCDAAMRMNSKEKKLLQIFLDATLTLFTYSFITVLTTKSLAQRLSVQCLP